MTGTAASEASERGPAAAGPDRIPRGRTLDFIVIGAQKAGTTSLFAHLRAHPQLWLPAVKEAPYFSTHASGGFEAFLRRHFRGAPRDHVWGKVTPHYMVGGPGIGVAGVADRIAATLPGVRVVALLRDPIDRAVSHYRMSVRRGLEQRCYVRRFPAENLWVGLTADLAARPAGLLADLYGFLGVDASFRPADLGVRHHRGGDTLRIPQEVVDDLRTHLTEHLWPYAPAELPVAFDYWFELWNVASSTEQVPMRDGTREALRCHYRDDAARIQRLWGVRLPWG